jgi:hypothetical protein
MLTETLESRLLMSASTNAALSAAVQTDRLQVQVDLLKFRADCLYSSSTMLSDILKIKADAGGKIPAVAPAVAKMHCDLNAMHQALFADRLTEAENVYADESVIAGARLKCLEDKGTSAETADRAALLADRIKLQNDMIAGLNARLATRQADYTQIFADGQTVIAAVQSDTNAAVVADVTKYVNDKATWMTTLSGDLQNLINDRTQLVADLTAEQTA